MSEGRKFLTSELTDPSKLGVRMTHSAGDEIVGIDAVRLTRQTNILGAVGIIQNAKNV